jgi:hypothetical protein
MDIIELPLIEEFTEPIESLQKMQEGHVAACIVLQAKNHYLVRRDRILESLQEWASPPTAIGRLIVPDEMTGGLPTLVGDAATLSERMPAGLLFGEMQLDGHARRYGIVTVTPTKVVIATRSERLAGYLRNPPDLYKCTQNARHIYSADRLVPGFLCPNIVHPIPKPSMIRL